MATKSVIDIEINDAKFKEFSAMFEKYQKSLGKMPGQWGNINKSVSSLQGNFNKIQHSLDSIAKSLDKNHVALKETEKTASKTSSSFEKMGKYAKSISGNVAATTFNLLKWGSLTTIAAGLLGAGSLFGLTSLSSSASNTRTESQSLGVTPGELKSAKLNYGRYGEVDSVLSATSNAQMSNELQTAFLSNRLNPNQSAAQLLPEIIKRTIEVSKGPIATLGSRLDASGLRSFGVTNEKARTWTAVGTKELDATARQAAQDQKLFNTKDSTLKAWQDLDVQLDKSKSLIENSFIVGLQGLSEPIAKLSSAFTNAVADLLKSPKLGEWIDRLGVGIQHFATYLASPDFEKEVSSFLEGVSKISHAVGTLADGISSISGVFGGTNSTVNSFLKPVFDAISPKSTNVGLNVMPQEWEKSLHGSRRKTLVPLSEIPQYKPTRHAIAPAAIPASTASNLPWNPFSMSLQVNHTKIPGQETNINMINAGGYYSSIRGG